MYMHPYFISENDVSVARFHMNGRTGADRREAKKIRLRRG